MNLKNLIREIHDGLTIYPSDMYNLYYLEYLYSTQPDLFKTDYGEFILHTYTQALKKKYLTVFKQLLAEQLAKYVSRQRIDPDFNAKAIHPTANAATLLDLMRKTYRSDMKRRNDVWIHIAEFVQRLENSKASADIFVAISMLNNAVHNTNTSVLGKIDHSHELVSAFERAKNAKSINDYEKFVDKDLRRLRSQHSFE
jgi:hypothetical protein